MDQNNVSPTPTAPESRIALDPVSTLLSQTAQWFNAHFTNLLKISGIFLGAQIILGILTVVIGLYSTVMDYDTLSNGGTIVGLIVSLLALVLVFGFLSLWNTLSLYTYIIKNDRAYPIRQVLADSRGMIFPYLGTSLMVGLFTLLGFFLLIIPGIYWGVLYGFAPLITLVEGKNSRALDRSKFLVKGHWWPIFLRQIVIGLLVYVFAVIINILFTVFFNALSSLYGPLGALGASGEFFSNILLAPIGLIFTFLLYQNLRRIKG